MSKSNFLNRLSIRLDQALLISSLGVGISGIMCIVFMIFAALSKIDIGALYVMILASGALAIITVILMRADALVWKMIEKEIEKQIEIAE